MGYHDARPRTSARSHRHSAILEPLEGRCLLTAGPAPSNPAEILNGLPANEGHDLNSLYKAFLQEVDPSKYSSLFPTLTITGTRVRVDVNGKGDFNTLLGTLRNLGMNVTASSAKIGLVEGDVPISQLAVLGASPQVLDVSPVYKPTLKAASVATAPSSTIGVPAIGSAFIQKLRLVPLYQLTKP
jgi:hypothetical protein